MGSFIKIDRKIVKWEWWSDINTFRLFFYMLITAYWKDGNYKGNPIPRGSFPSSVSELSKETNLTENEIRTALKHLKSTGEITSKSTNKFTVFSVKNYDLYQSDNKQNYEQITNQNTNEVQTDNEQLTNKSQTNNEQLTNSILKENKNEKNVKELKNEKNIISSNSNELDCQTQDVRRVLEAWNELGAYGIKTVGKLKSGTQRYQMLQARIREYGIDDVLTAIENVKDSDFLQGKHSGKPWQITFDWFVRPNNFPKVFEGNYSRNANSQTNGYSQTTYGNSRDVQFANLMEQIRRDEADDN